MSGYKKENIELLKDFITEANISRSSADTIKKYKNIYGKFGLSSVNGISKPI